MNEWISVEVQMPPDGEKYLVASTWGVGMAFHMDHCADSYFQDCLTHLDEGSFHEDDDEIQEPFEVSHWMPLPEPPNHK